MKRQEGAALLVLIMILVVAASFLMLKALNTSHIGRDKITSAALAQAKDALIGWAITYSDTHSSEVNGYLLLPDLGSSRNTTPEEGITAGNFPGNSNNTSVVGRLPWKTLGLAPLRDGSGECLWYAVSGTYQDQEKTQFMNWDTLGQFDTFTSNGTPGGTVSTVGTNYQQRPVAVIFAPGTTSDGQSRTTSVVDTVTECGGNYDTRNYLDTFNANPLINNIVNYFAGINNSTGIYPFATPKSLIMGPVADSSGNKLTNDRLLTLTSDDIFRAIKRRNNFNLFVNTDLLSKAKSELSSLPPPGTISDFYNSPADETSGGTTVGSLEIGRVPVSACTTTYLKRWQDNLLYARCISGSTCLTVNTSSCKGVVIFAGERTPSQIRASNTQKNDWTNYLEDTPTTVLTAFITGDTTFSGASSYSAATPSTDVLACIP